MHDNYEKTTINYLWLINLH